jgi:methyl-accepting chemotaxis protein
MYVLSSWDLEWEMQHGSPRLQSMANTLTTQVRSMTTVARAITAGDLNTKVELHGCGEVLHLETVINEMLEHLLLVADEVNRVTLEVSVNGNLNQMAVVKDVSGVWKELTDNANVSTIP